MPDPRFSKPSKQWSRKDHADYREAVSEAYAAAAASPITNDERATLDPATRSIKDRSVMPCTNVTGSVKNNCACFHCVGARAAHAKQAELTGTEDLNAKPPEPAPVPEQLEELEVSEPFSPVLSSPKPVTGG